MTMSDMIFNTIINTDGTNLFPKPATFENDLLDTFLDGDERWKEVNVRIGSANKIFYDTRSIDEDGAWIVCTGPTQVSEEMLRQIIGQERFAIWKPRSIPEWVEFILD